MEKLQPKSDLQNPSESILSLSMARDDVFFSVTEMPSEESEVIQETLRTYAKQIPKSPIKHNLKPKCGYQHHEQQIKEFNSNDQNVLKNVTNTQKKNQYNEEVQNCDENMSQRSVRKQQQQQQSSVKAGPLSEIRQENMFGVKDMNQQQGKLIQEKQQPSQQYDECLNTMQNMGISPRNSHFSNQILMTQQHDRSFTSQSSLYTDTLPYCTYDKENSHSGYINYQNIKPRKSLLSSIQKFSQKLFVNTKQIYNETLHNRKRCQCDINLREGETCSLAFSWMKSQYKNLDLVQMKEQYNSLLELHEMYSPFKPQIDRDAIRTFPGCGLFSEGGNLSQQLKNVLYAFSVYDIQVGYVQGMNFIVGIMLYHAEEYIAFWLTCMMFESLEMRDIYLPELPGIKKHIYLIEFLMWKHIPYLHQIFSDNDIKVEVICQSWLISLCGILIPIEYMTQFIDTLLKQGWSFFYRFVITYILFHEDEIIKQQDPGDVVVLLTSQSYQIEFVEQEDGMQWDQIMKSALNIKVNEFVIRDLLDKYDIEIRDFRRE